MTELFRIFREGIAAVLLIVSEHQYLALFGIVAVEEAGVPLPAPSDLVIMFYGDRARGDISSLMLVVLTCAAASTFGTLIPYLITRKYGDAAAHRIAGWIDVEPKRVDEWEERIALIYWSFWTLLGALFGPVVRRLIPRAYIDLVVLGIPIVVIGYFLFRFIRGRRRRAAASHAG